MGPAVKLAPDDSSGPGESQPPRLRRSRTSLTILLFDVAALGTAVALSDERRLDIPYALLALASLHLFEAGRRRIAPDLLLEAPKLVERLVLPILPVALLGHADPRLGSFMLFLPLTFALVLVSRAFCYHKLRSSGSRREHLETTIIVGSGSVARRAAEILEQHPRYGMRCIGFVDGLAGGESAIAIAPPLHLLGGLDDLAAIIAATGTTRILVAFGATQESELVPILRSCDGLAVEVYVVPRLFELGAWVGDDGADQIWDLPLVQIRRGTHAPAGRGKRAFDLAASGGLVALTAPVLAATALALRISQGRPVFFRQTRIGRDGQHFELLKFRTLPVNEGSDTDWIPSAPVTRFAELLRDTGLDELPQLFNVLRGDMSLVGPRPERPAFAGKFAADIPQYESRHRVRGGITGWAQIHGLHGDTSIEERARFDNYYIDTWSPWRDIVILIRTALELKPQHCLSIAESPEMEPEEQADAVVIRLPEVAGVSPPAEVAILAQVDPIFG